MKRHFLVCLSFLFVCCTPKSREDIQVEIINTEIKSSKPGDRDEIEKGIMSSEDYIFQTQNLNKINIRLTNNGQKTYVFFLHNDLDKTESSLQNVKALVYENNQVFAPKYLGYPFQMTPKAFEIRKLDNEMTSDSLKVELNEKYLKEDIDIGKIWFQREMSYVVIHPGEKKLFTFYRTFPVYSEPISAYYYYKFRPENRYYFAIRIASSKEIVKKHLTENQSREIEENGYSIFDGEVQSNLVAIHGY